MRISTAAISLAMLVAGCDEHSEALEQVSMRMAEHNTTVLQGPGIVIQGPGIVVQGPGIVIQGPGIVVQGPGIVVQGPGIVVQGISVNGPGIVVQGPGIVIQGPGIVIQGTTFSATLEQNGVTYNLSGLDFIGAELELRLTAILAGQPVNVDFVMRINDIKIDEKYPDVLLYDLTYRAKDSAEWFPYCGDSNVAAIPLQNYWDLETGDRIDNPNVVTFGCANAVLAKCTLWGYRPWATATRCDPKDKKNKGKKCEQVSLQDHHQACTRMARADYCGDGHPATVDGTMIDIWDKLAPPVQTQFTDWPIEAEWTPEGASCLNFMRHPEFGYPGCFLKKGKPMKFNKCGEGKDTSSLLFNSFSSEGADLIPQQ